MKIDHLAKSPLIDDSGSPLDPRVRLALSGLTARFAREFASIRDAAVVASLFEKAGGAIARHEEVKGPVERLPAFAWIVLRNLAVSWIRSPAGRVELASISGRSGDQFIGNRKSERGTADEIQSDILLRQILSTLSTAEREVVILRKAGFTSKEIAAKRGGSVSAVNTMMCRLKKRLAAVLPNSVVERK